MFPNCLSLSALALPGPPAPRHPNFIQNDIFREHGPQEITSLVVSVIISRSGQACIGHAIADKKIIAWA